MEPKFIFIAINIQKIAKRYKIYIQQISDKPHHKFPLMMDNIPPPSTTVGRQLSPLMRIPSLRDCFLSDGGFDVDKYLQRQTALRQRLLWRTSSALNLTNVVGESLSIGNQARGAAATGIKKTRAPRCVFSCKESADLELQVIKPNKCQWWKMYVENHFMLEDSSLHAKFWMQFRVPYANYLELL